MTEPSEGSFLHIVLSAHPNQDVRCGSYVGKAGSTARNVRHMMDEIARLQSENTRLTTENSKLVGRLVDLAEQATVALAEQAAGYQIRDGRR